MENVMFALGHEGRYFYNAPSKWNWNNLPKEIQAYFDAKRISDVICATFGDDDENLFFLYREKKEDGTTALSAFIGDVLPAEFREWLLDEDNKIKQEMESLRVVLGPDNSFVAWTSKSIRWSNIPKGLETTFQSWLTPAGWKSGPPRLVALGCSGAFFALSEYGASSYVLTGSMTTALEWFAACKQLDDFQWSSIQYIDFCASTPDRWVIVHGNTYVRGNLLTDSFFDVAESFAQEGVKKAYRDEREERKNAEKKASEEARAQQEQAEREQREHREQLELHYAIWVSTYEAAFKTPLQQFPHLPTAARTCRERDCESRRADTGLLSCRHDVESLLRTSPRYSEEWLRSERLRWHPDRFGRKCHPRHKAALEKQATAMYVIFEELIAAEQPEPPSRD